MRDLQDRPATLERPAPRAGAERVPPLGAPARPEASPRKAQGVRDLIGGAVLIGIGLAMGGSVFTGDPSVLDWFFDVLGTFWVVKGLYYLCT